jgi:hypothetical protein
MTSPWHGWEQTNLFDPWDVDVNGGVPAGTASLMRSSSAMNLPMLVTVYGPAHEEKKEQILYELANICSNIKIPTLIGGDFNILRFSGEKNRNFSHNRFIDMFNWIINTFELRDLNPNGGMYTWSNNQADPTLERLDRVLISPEWEALFNQPEENTKILI